MKNTIVGELYDSFSKNELKRFKKYITNSNWKNSDTVLRSHEYFVLLKEKDKWNDGSKEELFRYIYENDKFSDSKLRFTLNRLVKAVKEFVLIDAQEQNDIFSKKVWIDYIVSKKLKKNISYSLKDSDSVENSEYRYLYNYFKSQESSVNAFRFTKNIENQYQSIKSVMQEAAAFSDLVFLKNYCSLITFSTVYKSLPVEFPEQRLNEIKNKQYENTLPEFRVYLSLVDLLTNSDKPSYENYKSNVFDTLEIWGAEEKINLLTYLVNFNIVQMNSGKAMYADELYELYQSFEVEDLFSLKGYMNQNKINNVVSAYLRKSDFNLAKSFVLKYISLVTDANRDSCLHYNMAKIYFEQKEYKNSLRELLLVDFSRSAFYSLNSKVLLLKNYYELGETDALDSLISSFKQFIRKNKVISDTYKKSYLNFVKYTKRIYRQVPRKLKRIKSELDEEKFIAEKNWIITKIEEQLKGG